MSGRRVQDKRSRCSGQSSPVDFTANVGLGVTRAERHAGVARHSRTGRQTRENLELNLRTGDCGDLCDHGIRGQRVAGDQTHDVVAVLGLVHQCLCNLGRLAECRTHVRDQLAGLLVAAHVDADECDDALVDIRIGECHCGAGEDVTCANGEQGGVARSRSHEQDPSGSVLSDSGHR